MIERIWRDLFFHTHATAIGPLTALALCAIDTALWDRRCRVSGQPLHKEAGGAQASVPLYTTEGGWLHIETAELVEDALRAKAAGFGGCKVKIGRPPHEDVARLTAVREAVGAGFEIMVDGNQGATVDQAIRRARLYEPLDLAWYEEPMPAEDLSGHIRLSAATTLPVAVGESIYSLQHFREYLQRDACSVVQVDVARIGGITPWLKTAHLAESFNVPVCPHFLMELHVALSAAVPNGRWIEYIPQLDDLTTTGMRIEDGHAVPSNEPGLGIAWDWSAIDRRRVAECTLVVDRRG
jgi:L-alanine-DL-glutamate epimerase-like enolase superfamily enzyme